MIRSLPARVTLIAALLVLGAFSGLSAQADPPGSGPPARVATVLFLSYQSTGRPPFDPAALQAWCWDRLTARVHALGEREVTRQQMDPIVRKFGVRTNLGVGGDFLQALSAEGGAGTLLVFDLLVYADRILLCGRGVRTDTGRIEWADLEEQPLHVEAAETQPPELSHWSLPAEIAGDRLLRRWSERPTREEAGIDLFLLPVRTEGLEEATGRMIMGCLLRRLTDSPWRMEEPGVTFSRLRRAGCNPSLLDGRARAVLTTEGASLVLVSDIVAYDTPAASPTTEFREEAPVESATPLPAAALSIRLIDPQSGNLRFAATEYLGVPPTHGLFGTARSVSLVERVQPAADRLVDAARKKG